MYLCCSENLVFSSGIARLLWCCFSFVFDLSLLPFSFLSKVNTVSILIFSFFIFLSSYLFILLIVSWLSSFLFRYFWRPFNFKLLLGWSYFILFECLSEIQSKFLYAKRVKTLLTAKWTIFLLIWGCAGLQNFNYIPMSVRFWCKSLLISFVSLKLILLYKTNVFSNFTFIVGLKMVHKLLKAYRKNLHWSETTI